LRNHDEQQKAPAESADGAAAAGAEAGSAKKPKVDVAKLECGIRRIYLVREIAVPQPPGWINRFLLENWPYLGPSSTLAELAFLKCNLALIGPSLYASSCRRRSGGNVLGSDIGWRVLHGKLRVAKSSVAGNFAHYALPRPELVVADHAYSPFVFDSRFDAIVTDPPYGVRAGARKTEALSSSEHCLHLQFAGVECVCS
jgi:tRNA G10  N-methylase Trm11